MIRLWLVGFLFFIGALEAGSLRLLNDSPAQLRAVVRGNDGSYLGEMIINPQQMSTWSDSYTQMGTFGPGNPYSQGPSRSQTPYTVFWYCLDGAEFSICTLVSTGSTVNALGGDGRRICSAKKKQDVPPHGQLHDKNSVPPSNDQ